MFTKTREIYKATRKKHDLVFNVYVMRPLAAFVVAVLEKTGVTPNQVTLLNLFVFLVAAAIFVVMPTYVGGLVAVGVLELSYLFDCADGMLARRKKLASKTGHLFDFFTDELKATVLVACLGVRLHATGGYGVDGAAWTAGDTRFLFATIVGTVVIASALSLTNFVRHPEMSGKATTVEAFYETADHAKPKSLVARVVGLAMGSLQFLGHYPSHIWIFALVGRFEAYFWVYIAINLLYLGRGWLGLVLRFGRG